MKSEFQKFANQNTQGTGILAGDSSQNSDFHKSPFPRLKSQPVLSHSNSTNLAKVQVVPQIQHSNDNEENIYHDSQKLGSEAINNKRGSLFSKGTTFEDRLVEGKLDEHQKQSPLKKQNLINIRGSISPKKLYNHSTKQGNSPEKVGINISKKLFEDQSSTYDKISSAKNALRINMQNCDINANIQGSTTIINQKYYSDIKKRYGKMDTTDFDIVAKKMADDDKPWLHTDLKDVNESFGEDDRSEMD